MMKGKYHFERAAGIIGLALLLHACNVPDEYSNIPKTKTISIDSFPAEPLDPLLPGEIEQIFLNEGLVDVQSFSSEIKVELRYSTKNNFTGVDLYGPLKKCYLRKEAAEKLAKAQQILNIKKPGWHFLCYDCARPRSIQQQMWDSLKIPNKKNYLTPPSKGSMHNYGAAVDLTLADEKGKAIDMGTPFDFFGEEAQPQKEYAMLAAGKLTQEQLDNRMLLRKTMREALFSSIITEWWHFIAFRDSVVYIKYKIIE